MRVAYASMSGREYRVNGRDPTDSVTTASEPPQARVAAASTTMAATGPTRPTAGASTRCALQSRRARRETLWRGTEQSDMQRVLVALFFAAAVRCDEVDCKGMRTKAPKIQRLVTQNRLQRKRRVRKAIVVKVQKNRADLAK